MIVILHCTLESAELSRVGGHVPLLEFDKSFTDSPLEAGVDLFFVISGCVMVVSSAQMFARAGSAREFLTRRLVRVVPLYWFATALFLGTTLLSPALVHDGDTTLRSVILSLLFIPFFHPDGSNKPVYKLGWTLNYEMYFYACFSLVTVLPPRKAVAALTVVFALLVTAGFYFPGGSAAWGVWTDPLLFEFIIGAWIGLAVLENIRVPRTVTILLLVAGTALIFSRSLPWIDRSLTYGLPAAMVVAASALAAPLSTRFGRYSFVGAAVAFGDASYVLYVIHPFVVRAVRLVWVRFGPTGTAAPWLFIIATSAIAAAVALLAHHWLELPFNRWMQSRLSFLTRRPAGVSVPVSP